MKHINIFPAVLAVIFMTTACRSETGVENNPEISVTVTIPDPMDNYTKAPLSSSDAFSHLGGAMTVDPSVFDLRYIVEVWTNDVTPKLLHRETKSVDNNFTSTSVSFKIPIQSLPCRFVFWADFVEQGSSEDLHYKTVNNLQNISYADNITSVGDLAAEEMDAYCAVVQIESISNDQKRNVVLKRPFGKLRLLATDKVDGGELEGQKPTIATIDFKDGVFANTYNVLTGKAAVNSQATLTGKSDFNIIRENALVNGIPYEEVYLLGVEYLFITDQVPSYSIDVTVYEDESKTSIFATKNLSSIPLVTNKLTTVIGDFYSSHGSVNIIVADEFEDHEIGM